MLRGDQRFGDVELSYRHNYMFFNGFQLDVYSSSWSAAKIANRAMLGHSKLSAIHQYRWSIEPPRWEPNTQSLDYFSIKRLRRDPAHPVKAIDIPLDRLEYLRKQIRVPEDADYYGLRKYTGGPDNTALLFVETENDLFNLLLVLLLPSSGLYVADIYDVNHVTQTYLSSLRIEELRDACYPQTLKG